MGLASGLILSNGFGCISVFSFFLSSAACTGQHHPEMGAELTHHSEALCLHMIMSRESVRMSLQDGLPEKQESTFSEASSKSTPLDYSQANH